MQPHPLKTYLAELFLIRSTGAATDELSFYGPLSGLLNAVGQTLKPRVRCVMNLKNQGDGMPDGGLFTPDQFQRGADQPLSGQPPGRGVVECKKARDDAWKIAATPQVSRYWNKYRQVLVTNYRDFILVGQDAAGRAARPDALITRQGNGTSGLAGRGPHAGRKDASEPVNRCECQEIGAVERSKRQTPVHVVHNSRTIADGATEGSLAEVAMPHKKDIKKLVGCLMAAYREYFQFDPMTAAPATVMFYSDKGNQFGLDGSWRARFKKSATECKDWLDLYPLQGFERFLQTAVADAKEAIANDAETSAVFHKKLEDFFKSIADSSEWVVASAVFGLAAAAPPFSVGPCRFFVMDEAGLHRWGQRRRCVCYDPPSDTIPQHHHIGLDRQLLGNWVAEVRVRAIGGSHAAAKARYRLEEVLNVLRHGAFLLGLPEQCVRAGVGHPSYWNSQSICVRVHPPGGFQDSAGNGADGLMIQTSCLGSSAWRPLGTLIAKEPTSRTKLEATVMTALEWVGQAAAAPLGPVRLVSLMTALEVLLLLNGEARGKRMKLAKRAARIAPTILPGGSGLTPGIIQRLLSPADGLEQAADKLYRMRSECLHEGATQVEDDDVETAYAFVDAVTTAFLTKDPFCKCGNLSEVLDSIRDPDGGFVYQI